MPRQALKSNLKVYSGTHRLIKLQDGRTYVDSLDAGSRDDTYSLDPKGDAILILLNQASLNARKLLVSSRVLSLASPVFAALFSPRFQEGSILVHGDRPSMGLKMTK